MDKCTLCGKNIIKKDDVRLITKWWFSPKPFHKECAFSKEFKLGYGGIPVKPKTFLTTLIIQILISSFIILSLLIFFFNIVALILSIIILITMIHPIRLYKIVKRDYI